MPRDHVEFIQAQRLPWSPLGTDSARPGAEIKVLSRDQESGACSAVIRYPAGWALGESHYLSCDEELYVLEGEFAIGDATYGQGDYAYLPAGCPRDAMRSGQGAAALTFFEGRAANVPAAACAAYYDGEKLIGRVATAEAEWVGASDPKVASSQVERLVLRPDTPDGERTWLLSVDGSPSQPFEVNGVEQHPCVEEMFLVDGEFAMTCGIMRTGAYFWRPPMIRHGPMGTRHGFLGLFRAKEGAFSTVWSDPPGPIVWDVPYAPALPAGFTLEDCGYDRTLRY